MPDTSSSPEPLSLAPSQRVALAREARSAGLALLQLANESERLGPDLPRDYAQALHRAARRGLDECEKMLDLPPAERPLTEQLMQLEAAARSWWPRRGLGSLKTIRFRPNGASLTLGCLLDDWWDDGADTPGGRAALIEGLKAQGFLFDADPDGETHRLVDSDDNRARVEALVTRELPSARLLELYTKGHGRPVAHRYLDELHVYVRDLNDLARLEQLAA